MSASRTRPGRLSCTSTAPATSILPWRLRPGPPSGGSCRCGFRSRRSRPSPSAASGRAPPWRGEAGRRAATPSCTNRAPVVSAVAGRRCRWGGHQEEPDGQRELRAVHRRPGGDRRLLAAARALPPPGERSGRKLPSLAMPARRAPEAVRPTRCGKIRDAGGLVGKTALELRQRTGKVDHDALQSAFAFRSSLADRARHHIS